MRLLVGLVTAVAGAVLLVTSLTTSGGTPSAALRDGATLFVTKGCAACHAAPGLPGGGIGPDLRNVAPSAEHIRESIVDPAARRSSDTAGGWVEMPQLPLDDDEVDALVAYLLAPPETQGREAG